MVEKTYQFRNPSLGTVLRQLFEEPSMADGAGRAGWLVNDACCADGPRVALRYLGGCFDGAGDLSPNDIIEVPTLAVDKVGLYECSNGTIAVVTGVPSTGEARIYGSLTASTGSVVYLSWQANGETWPGGLHGADRNLVKFIGSFEQAVDALRR